ncbi:MAG: type II secretion system protein [Verrucomicrobiaceae bacterium]
MQLARFRFNSRAFTLVEMLIVLSIIALLAALTMGGYTYAMRSSKRRLTHGTFEAIKVALDRYFTEFGEFPEPAESGQIMEIIPNKSYDVSGAACLYQALTGDGYDHIKGISSTGSDDSAAKSDGKVQGTDEIAHKMLAEIPQTIWTRKGSFFIMIDGFGRPFQYVKSTPPTGGNTKPNTINSTYDLWSYSEDEGNITKKSTDTVDSPKIAMKWIKNW